MNSTPLAVATEPPMLDDPVFITPIFSSDSTRPKGTRQATSPVLTFMANSSPQGGVWHGQPVAGSLIGATFFHTNSIWLQRHTPSDQHSCNMTADGRAASDPQARCAVRRHRRRCHEMFFPWQQRGSH